jgi:hypothetical protein
MRSFGVSRATIYRALDRASLAAAEENSESTPT